MAHACKVFPQLCVTLCIYSYHYQVAKLDITGITIKSVTNRPAHPNLLLTALGNLPRKWLAPLRHTYIVITINMSMILRVKWQSISDQRKVFLAAFTDPVAIEFKSVV